MVRNEVEPAVSRNGYVNGNSVNEVHSQYQVRLGSVPDLDITMCLSGGERLPIDGKRLCACPPTHINCMTAKEWMKSQIGVWQFTYEGRDIRNKELHPATFPISLARKIIELFTHKGELVLDPFVGSGTSLVAAQDLDGCSMPLRSDHE